MQLTKYYFGNYPNSSEYNPNIPIGWNRWDAMEHEEEEPEEDIQEPQNDDDYE